MGFHGSPFANFHSIVRHGFQEKYIKYGHGLFGDGIYFSTDPLVAKNFISYYQLPRELIRILGDQFVNKVLGSRIGCCIVCDVVKHPNGVKFSSDTSGNGYIGIQGDSKIAKHYVMASSSQYIRHRYLFIYSKFDNSKKFILLIIALYIIVLAFVAALKYKGIKRLFSP